ncbi:MAG: hypothetical protein Q7T07_12630 [Burkholderiaceae bacterium]|nr:hypothetical protein [Burkholderiaceae bacterium]
MKDDFDRLFEVQATAADKPEDAPSIPAAPSIRMQLFRSGARVTYQGELYTVSHVQLSKGQLLVHLHELASVVPSEKLSLELTRFTLGRT